MLAKDEKILENLKVEKADTEQKMLKEDGHEIKLKRKMSIEDD